VYADIKQENNQVCCVPKVVTSLKSHWSLSTCFQPRPMTIF
jgi:hypothetical protein